MSGGIVFEVETSRILEILSKEIYDSPLALLRENLQNAYDATLMAASASGCQLEEMTIEVIVSPNCVEIVDHGIGMTEEVLRNNFWKAGSSGKRTELARESGVVGTFGIGAMANFGVCTRLRVETRHADSDETLISAAERSNLSIARECITLERRYDNRAPGTTIIAELDSSQAISVAAARSYLDPYVAFVPAKITINEQLISQQRYEGRLGTAGRGFSLLKNNRRRAGEYAVTLEISADTNGQVLVRGSEITLANESVRGNFVLVQNGGQLYALRTNFGLAPVPNAGIYQLGGYFNLSILHPTAGREALSRESIGHLTQLIALCELEITDVLAGSVLCDKNTAFLQHLFKLGKYQLAGNISVRMLPDEVDVPMNQVRRRAGTKELHYYPGRDISILNTFAGESSALLHVSQSNPRRQVQNGYLSTIAKIPQVPDSVRLNNVYSGRDLTVEEASVLIRITITVTDDYLLANAQIHLAEISHGVAIYAKQTGEYVDIYISRSSSTLRSLIQTYKTAYEVFPGFVKDFVRVHLYPKIQQFVPSSTKQGADALRKVLERNRELYRYEESEFGNLESVLGDYLSGEVSLGDVLKIARTTATAQSQIVSSDQVGDIENELPDVVSSPAAPLLQGEGSEYMALPPILRLELTSKMKILTTATKFPQLNNFTMLLGLSDRIVRMEGDFFRWPHTTKVIWASHRVIYIFTDTTGKLSLYYDIELRDPLDAKATGGGMFPSTTLITSDRIYVPVPDPLVDSFRISSGPKEFFVRFDTLFAPSSL